MRGAFVAGAGDGRNSGWALGGAEMRQNFDVPRLATPNRRPQTDRPRALRCTSVHPCTRGQERKGGCLILSQETFFGE